MTRSRPAALALAAALAAAAWLAAPDQADAPAAPRAQAHADPLADWLAGGPGPDHGARAYPRYAQQQVTTPIRFLGVQRLVRRMAEGESLAIIDVRTQPEFEQARIPGAINIPLDQIEQRLDEVPRQGTVVLY